APRSIVKPRERARSRRPAIRRPRRILRRDRSTEPEFFLIQLDPSSRPWAKARSRKSRMRAWTMLVAATLLGCGGGDAANEDDLTSATGDERVIQWDGWVYVPVGANDGAVHAAIARQVKSAIG